MSKTHRCVINKTANHVSYKRINPDDAMLTECICCLPIRPTVDLERTKTMPPKKFTLPPVSIVTTYNGTASLINVLTSNH